MDEECLATSTGAQPVQCLRDDLRCRQHVLHNLLSENACLRLD
jgi:hypothetical protein